MVLILVFLPCLDDPGSTAMIKKRAREPIGNESND